MTWRHQPLFFLYGLSLCAGCTTTPSTPPATETLEVFIGAYTDRVGPSGIRASGVSHILLDTSGKIIEPARIDSGQINPSFLTLSRDKKFMYVVEETGPEGPDSTGHIRAYTVEPDGLKFINRQSTHGFAPCHVQTDKQNRFAFVANYGGGIALFPIGADGSLAMASSTHNPQATGPHPRQDAAHPHAVFLSPDEKYLYVPDLGADRIYIYQIDAVAGKLIPAEPAFCPVAAGAGPRHLTFHPSLPFAYVINELNNTITQFAHETHTGQLTVLESIPTLPPDVTEPSFCADIHITPDGRFLYGTNRGHDSLVGFQIDAKTGKLLLIGHTSTRGKFPRNFNISPNGQWLLVANQQSDNLVGYRIQSDGKLTYRWEIASPTPVCIQWGSK